MGSSIAAASVRSRGACSKTARSGNALRGPRHLMAASCGGILWRKNVHFEMSGG